jgi:hypothetical protein
VTALDQAKAEHAAAKDAFANNPTPASQSDLTNAAAAVAEAGRQAAAQAAEERAAKTRKLIELRTSDEAGNERAHEITKRLRDLETSAFALIDEIESICRGQAEAFQTRKRLALELGEPVGERPRTSNERATKVQDAINLSQRADGRFTRSNARQVSTYLQPSIWGPAKMKSA